MELLQVISMEFHGDRIMIAVGQEEHDFSVPISGAVPVAIRAV